MHLVRGKHVHDELHARRCIGRIPAVGEPGHQFAERVERFARRTRVTFAQVLPREKSERAEVVVEVDQAAQVPRVVGTRVRRIELEEAVERRDRGDRLGILPLRVGEFEHRLLRVAAERIPRLERLVELDRARPVAVVHLVTRFGVELRRRPAARLVEVAHRRTAADQTGGHRRDHHLPHCQYTRASPPTGHGRAGSATCPIGMRSIGIRSCGFHRFVRSMASN